MSEINNSGFNPNKDIKMPQPTSMNHVNNNISHADSTQQHDASAPVSEALGKSMVKVDNHDADMQKLLKNPKLAEVSDKMFNAASMAGIAYPEAATFATIES